MKETLASSYRHDEFLFYVLWQKKTRFLLTLQTLIFLGFWGLAGSLILKYLMSKIILWVILLVLLFFTLFFYPISKYRSSPKPLGLSKKDSSFFSENKLSFPLFRPLFARQSLFFILDGVFILLFFGSGIFLSFSPKIFTIFTFLFVFRYIFLFLSNLLWFLYFKGQAFFMSRIEPHKGESYDLS